MIVPFGDKTPKIHSSVFLSASASIVGDVKLGKNASVWFGAVLRGDINSVSVGAESNIQDNCVLHVARKYPCIIKNRVTVGHQATIHACTIQSCCLIGIGATVLDGAIVGKHSIIGAGATVLGGVKIPPRSLVVGTPGKVIRRLEDREIEALEKSADNYINLSAEYKKQRNGLLIPRRFEPIDIYKELFR